MSDNSLIQCLLRSIIEYDLRGQSRNTQIIIMIIVTVVVIVIVIVLFRSAKLAAGQPATAYYYHAGFDTLLLSRWVRYGRFP